jgi:inactivated superfamily I helicase
MPPTIPPPDGHPPFLTTSAERTVAGQAIHTATPGTDPAVCLATADLLDQLSAGVLAAVGVGDPDEQRAVLSILWCSR